MTDIKLKSTITCPECGHASTEMMPTEACQFFWECPSCKTVLRPKQGDCCVFCSCGDIPCPPVQQAALSPAVRSSCCD
ncbi:MAG TPA: GDCCVxC domain-containing (seleno)protein [Chloroflexota bacterium]|nr:GDCCVxC domain-containing (seleno)protein [Chloroflexota bacterium]